MKLGRLQVRWQVVAVAIVLAVVIARLSTPRGPVHVYDDQEETRGSILEQVPSGAGVERAREVMERSRFKCAVEERLPDPPPFNRRLYCWRTDLSWILFPKEWRVSFWLGKDNSIDTVTVTYGVTGP